MNSEKKKGVRGANRERITAFEKNGDCRKTSKVMNGAGKKTGKMVAQTMVAGVCGHVLEGGGSSSERQSLRGRREKNI